MAMKGTDLLSAVITALLPSEEKWRRAAEDTKNATADNLLDMDDVTERLGL